MPSVPTTRMRLKVQQIDKVCLFELTWGRNQQLSATLPYPPLLAQLYEQWRRTYLSFYNTLPTGEAIAPTTTDLQSPLRGRVVESGSLAPVPVDWHARLVEAEAKLMYEFQRWLRSAELFEIRNKIDQVCKSLISEHQTANLFLTCTPLDLAKLPWETWELSTEFSGGKLRLVRTPANIRSEIGSTCPTQRGKARILAILGDESGLNFQVDKQAVQALQRVADVHFEGWQPDQTPEQVQANICQAIADPDGWDILFFAGHSNETEFTGGELAIAPHVYLQIKEIAPYLTQAKEKGLQFAIFNSCSGMNIAESLIDLGLSQVAVMREPIHNRVAQEFLVQFLQQLAAYKDVHASLLTTCQFLKLEKNFTYPSAYLLPCLFQHPDANAPFQIEPQGWVPWVKSLLPTPTQAIAFGALLSLSLFTSVQDALINQRLGVQARYRDITRQVPAVTQPAVTLVQIDDKSIRLSGMSTPNPIDRSYLAQIIDRLTEQRATVIGIDYLLDREQPGNDTILGNSVRQAIANDHTWFVFGAVASSTLQSGIGETTGIATPNWSLQGTINAFPNYMRLPVDSTICYESCPFAYLLALVHSSTQEGAQHLSHPDLTSTTDLATRLLDVTQDTVPTDSRSHWIRQTHQLPLTTWAAEFRQRWLRPIIDYSVPNHLVYQRVPAWQILDPTAPARPSFSNQVVIIAPGGYSEAGVGAAVDSFPMPVAMTYWRDRLYPNDSPIFTGAEAHAYMIHHLLSRTLTVPIPDSWLIATALLLGKGTTSWIEHRRRCRQWSRTQRRYTILSLGGVNAVYGAAALQVFVTAHVLLPLVLPSAMFWAYVLPVLRRPPNERPTTL